MTSFNIEGDIDMVSETQLYDLGYRYEMTTGVTERLYSKSIKGVETDDDYQAIWIDSVDALKDVSFGIEGNIDETVVQKEMRKLMGIGFKISYTYNRD